MSGKTRAPASEPPSLPAGEGLRGLPNTAAGRQLGGARGLGPDGRIWLTHLSAAGLSAIGPPFKRLAVARRPCLWQGSMPDGPAFWRTMVR
ncbi:MAG: hypothetical protein KGO02_07430, partial [Alphaproteobacteria bacterium]|nr:hypothetical protein [Alphaproteobacteria bacterium]